MLRHATGASDRLYVQGIHEVGGALRTSTGEIFSAIHFELPSGAVGVCGEIAAICCMVAAGYRKPATITGVWRDPAGQHYLLPPCGRCREAIADFNPEAWVIISAAEDHWHPNAIEKPAKVRIADLLPLKSHQLRWPEA
ncbi:MAG: hypothetical protein INR62_04510 [Rhodospirillales bacterium]|nr:hypothetical protein [Acetobacter sp.]